MSDNEAIRVVIYLKDEEEALDITLTRVLAEKALDDVYAGRATMTVGTYIIPTANISFIEASDVEGNPLYPKRAVTKQYNEDEMRKALDTLRGLSQYPPMELPRTGTARQPDTWTSQEFFIKQPEVVKKK